MSRGNVWITWLKIVGFGLVLFGTVMTFFNSTPVFSVFNQGIDPVFWKAGLPDEGTRAFHTWVYGAWGATIAGWGISLLLILYNAFSRKERWAWYAIGAGLVVWYVLDTGISAYFGVTFNVIFNTIIMVIVIVPLAATYRWFIP